MADEPSLMDHSEESLRELQRVARANGWCEVFVQGNETFRAHEPKCPGCGRGVAYITESPSGVGYCYACGSFVEREDA